MKIELVPTMIEVTARKRRGYRMPPGYYVVIDGRRQYPPMNLRDAQAFVRRVKREQP